MKIFVGNTDTGVKYSLSFLQRLRNDIEELSIDLQKNNGASSDVKALHRSVKVIDLIISNM